LKELLKERVVFGTCVLSTSPHYLVPTKNAGCDFVFLDTEHVAIDQTQLAWMCRAFDAMGVTPITRVPEPEPYRVCEYIDNGAVGVVAPYCETVK